MNTFNGEIHPAAAIWPMLPEDDLKRLAEDIKENGLSHAILLDADGRIVDGKNRLAACQIAEVEPRFETYKGDAVAKVLTENNERNHLSTGRRAMAVAMTLAFEGYRQNGKWAYGSVKRGKSPTLNSETWQDAMKRAGVVLDHNAEDAPKVVAGTVMLDAAYKTALDNREQAERIAALGPELSALVESGVIDPDEAERRAAFSVRYDELPPDLQKRVDDGLDISEAEVVVRDREQRIKVQAESIGSGLTIFTRMAGNPLPEALNGALTELGVDVAAVITIIKALEESGYGSSPG